MQHDHVPCSQLQIRIILEDIRRERPPRLRELPRDIREILDYIDREIFDSRLNVAVLKSRCRIRDNNISSRFRYLMGVTIKAYIEDLRLRAAERLLRQGDLNVFDVAASVGYYHPQTFYRAFQRKYQCTPSEYRKGSIDSVRN